MFSVRLSEILFVLLFHFTNGFIAIPSQTSMLKSGNPGFGISIMSNKLDLDQIEADALNAAEMWDFSATAFLDSDASSQVSARMADRGDVCK